MSLLSIPDDDEPSLPKDPPPGADWASVPTVLTLRVCALALIGGVGHSMRADVAFAAGWARPHGKDPRMDGAALRGACQEARADMGFRFSLALERSLRAQGGRGFRLELADANHAHAELAMKAMGGRAAVLSLCASVDERAWSLWDRMEEGLHPAYASLSGARSELVDLVLAAGGAFARHGPAEAGLTLDPGPPLALEFEASPIVPFGAHVPFSRLQVSVLRGPELWGSIADRMFARREGLRISDGLAGAAEDEEPERRRRPAL